MKNFVYNFGGMIYETTIPFDENYRKMKAECIANGEPFYRQEIDGEKIVNQVYVNGIWIDE